jgi:hypothetical protein
MGQHERSGRGDPKAPHVFVEVDLLPMSTPRADDTGGARYGSPPTPGGRSRVCGICKRPRGDRIHIEGEVRADAESPRWG